MPETDASLAALRKTKDALKQIKTALVPFLKLLKEDRNRPNSDDNERKETSTSKKRMKPDTDEKPKLDAHTRAESEAAVALAIGTLRYMGARLRGFDQGRKKDDPLRVELDKIRAKLVELKKLDAANESTEDNKSKETTPCEKERRQNKVKRRKVLDKNASGRMINNAL